MARHDKIRFLALGWVQDGDRVFLSEGYDPHKRKTFYRSLGGGVNFGEPSVTALQREFQEEIQAELTNIRYLGCLENLFEFDGRACHEVIQFYRCDFADARFYQLDQLQFSESDTHHTALWVPVEKLRSGELFLVPERCTEYL